jgi:hypothetical protein
MMSLGKVGYIDPDTNLHTIPTNVTYNNGYQKFVQHSNVSGNRMKDCTKLSFVKYGDRVVLAANDLTAYVSSDSVMNFKKDEKQVFIIRPLPNGIANGTPIRFGDQVSLALSVSNYTTVCGYWGCQVGTIEEDSQKFIFQRGGTTGGTPVQLMPTSAAYSVGDTITYGTPFNVAVALIPQNNALYGDQVMRPGGDPLMSTDEEYYMTFEWDGIVRLYRATSSAPLWTSETGPGEDKNKNQRYPKLLKISSSGVLQAQEEGGSFYWSSKSKNGTPPFALAVQTNGQLVLYDKYLKPLWSVGEPNGRVVNKLEEFYATVNESSEMYFDRNGTKGIFSFQNEDGSSLTTPEVCDLADMEAQCGNSCIGFIHDPQTNEWQTLTKTAKATDFKITNTTQDFYMKIPKVSLADKSCKKEFASFVDFSWLSKAVPGTELSSKGKNQCIAGNNLNSEYDDYDSLLNQEWSKTQEDAYNFDNSPLNNLKATEAAIDEATGQTNAELQAYMKKLQNIPAGETYEKQVSDSRIIDRQSKYRSALWVIIAVLVTGLVLIGWVGGVWAAIYSFGTLVALYLGYVLFR